MIKQKYNFPDLKIIECEHNRVELAMSQLADLIFRNEALLTESERDILLGILLAPRLRSGGKHRFKYHRDLAKTNSVSYVPCMKSD